MSVAFQLLAPPVPAPVLALIGAGTQARSHYRVFSDHFQFSQVRVCSRSGDSARRLAREIGAVACRDAAEAARGADIIVVAVASTEPVLRAEWVRRGAHVCAIGATRPEWRELDPALLHSATLYVDTRAGALKESGDVILSKAEIYAEIGEVINGTKQAFPERTTVFKSLGMALEDLVAARLVYENHMKTARL